MRDIAILSGRGIGDFITLINFLYSLSRDGVKNNIFIFLEKKNVFEELIKIFRLKRIHLVTLTRDNLISTIVSFRRKPFDYIISRCPGTANDDLISLLLKGKRLGYRRTAWAHLLTCSVPVNEALTVEENERLYLGFMGVRYKKFPLSQLFPSDAKREKNNCRLLVGMHIGARNNDPSRLWPTEKWIQVIKFTEKLERKPTFFFFGNSQDKELFDKILDVYNEFSYVECFNLPLRQTLQSMRNVDMFLSTNSGFMHVAALLQLPQVVLCGPSRREWYPNNKKAEIVTTDNKSDFKLKSEKQMRKSPKYFVSTIKPDKVIGAINILLEKYVAH